MAGQVLLRTGFKEAVFLSRCVLLFTYQRTMETRPLETKSIITICDDKISLHPAGCLFHFTGDPEIIGTGRPGQQHLQKK